MDGWMDGWMDGHVGFTPEVIGGHVGFTPLENNLVVYSSLIMY